MWQRVHPAATQDSDSERDDLVGWVSRQRCPHHAEVLALVERVRAQLGIDVELCTALVADREAASRVRFPGSPTIRIDGRDVEPGGPPPAVSRLSCRLYRHQHGLTGMPLERWIRDALLSATTR